MKSKTQEVEQALSALEQCQNDIIQKKIQLCISGLVVQLKIWAVLALIYCVTYVLFDTTTIIHVGGFALTVLANPRLWQFHIDDTLRGLYKANNKLSSITYEMIEKLSGVDDYLYRVRYQRTTTYEIKD